MPSGIDSLTLHVTCNEHQFTLSLSSNATIASLRSCIAASDTLRSVAGLRDARLISAGHLLGDPTATLAAAGLSDGSFVHVAPGSRSGVVASSGPTAGFSSANSGSSGGHANAYAGAAMWPTPAGGGGGSQPPPPQQQQPQPQPQPNLLRGFDRLALLGLDSDGIELLRLQFLQEVIAANLADPRHLPGESEADRLLRNEVSEGGQSSVTKRPGRSLRPPQATPRRAIVVGRPLPRSSTLSLLLSRLHYPPPPGRVDYCTR